MSPNEPGDRPRVLDAPMLARGVERDGVFWSVSSDQLHLNLVHLGPGQGVVAHTNDEVDVVGAVLAGEAVLGLPDGERRLRPGSVFFVPRGVRRALGAGEAGCTYVTCHQRRRGLWPAPARDAAGR
jgi:quercetin dioxygenase-like cupin family protein